MKRVIALLAISACVLFPTGMVLGGVGNPSGTGQPNQSCESQPSAPSSSSGGGATSSTNTGSAFSPSGKSGTVYAGEQPQNSNNQMSVSQYDVACFQQP
jgi:hypothetical protein